MKKLILFLLLLLPLVAICQRQIDGTIIKVHDGDTYKFIPENTDSVYTLRMLGIDTPELKQDGGILAMMFVKNKIIDKTVTIVIKGKDRYNRYLVDLYYDSSLIWLNKQIISSGNGVVYMSKNKALIEEEQKAKLAKKGIWGSNNFIVPSQFRKNSKKK